MLSNLRELNADHPLRDAPHGGFLDFHGFGQLTEQDIAENDAAFAQLGRGGLHYLPPSPLTGSRTKGDARIYSRLFKERRRAKAEAQVVAPR
jgi:hypothetical protein